MKTLSIPLTFIAVLWIVHIITWATGTELGTLGIYPHKWSDWENIFTAPLIHGNWEHLISNTVPLLILGWFLFVSYPKQAILVYLVVYLLTGILVLLFGRASYHIGASGMVYGMASFLFVAGIIRGDTGAIAIALIVAFLYGSLVWGILPHQPGISWESHLFGGITGIVLALLLVKHQDTSTVEILPGKTFRDFIEHERDTTDN